jgi:hypothetical protein
MSHGDVYPLTDQDMVIACVIMPISLAIVTLDLTG